VRLFFESNSSSARRLRSVEWVVVNAASAALDLTDAFVVRVVRVVRVVPSGVRATSGAANRRVLVVLGRKRKRIYRRFRESLYEGRVMNRRGITYFTRKRTMKDSTIVISLLVQY